MQEPQRVERQHAANVCGEQDTVRRSLPKHSQKRQDRSRPDMMVIKDTVRVGLVRLLGQVGIARGEDGHRIAGLGQCFHNPAGIGADAAGNGGYSHVIRITPVRALSSFCIQAKCRAPAPAHRSRASEVPSRETDARR